MIIRTVFLLLFFPFVSFSQTEMQKFYESKKYEKAIKLCEKNIKTGTEKQKSLLFKSLVLLDASDNKYILKTYEHPVYEAIKCIKRIESYRLKKPEDPFFPGYSRQLKYSVKKINTVSDSLYYAGDKKLSLKLMKKMIEIYPDEDVYLFKLARLYEFDLSAILYKHDNITEDDYYDKLYKVSKNSIKYLKKSSKKDLINALNILYDKDSCDLQAASCFLVMYKRNHGGDDKINEIQKNFQLKYWQIDMLIKVNKHRAKGYTCGDDEYKAKQPLILDNCLTRTTQKYAELCFKENHFSHTGPDGSSPWKRASEEGCYADGENIAWGSSSVNGALRQWMNSPGHCGNIMGSHTKMGIGEAGSYWVQLFK
jgi:tetratricopeptide (TPR) repeat protein